MKPRRTKENPVGLIYLTVGLLLFIGPGIISYIIQKNTYDGPNFLFGVSEAMGHPLWLTSFTYLLSWSFLILGYMLAENPKHSPGRIAYMIFIVINALNVPYEIGQALINPYQDTHGLDILAGLAATALFRLIIAIIHGNGRRDP